MFSSIESEVKRAIEIVGSSLTLPEFSGILICDGSEIYNDGKLSINIDSLYSLEDFQKHFENIQMFGYPWVNIQVLGLIDRSIVCVFETPAYFPTEGSKRTSFNISGPYIQFLQQNGWNLSSLLFKDTKVLSSKRVKEYLLSGKASISPNRLAEVWNPFEIEPKSLFIGWDYLENTTFRSWLVYFNRKTMHGVVYSEFGFGPKNPWGLISLSETPPRSGMDCSWASDFSSALEIFF